MVSRRQRPALKLGQNNMKTWSKYLVGVVMPLKSTANKTSLVLLQYQHRSKYIYKHENDLYYLFLLLLMSRDLARILKLPSFWTVVPVQNCLQWSKMVIFLTISNNGKTDRYLSPGAKSLLMSHIVVFKYTFYYHIMCTYHEIKKHFFTLTLDNKCIG